MDDAWQLSLGDDFGSELHPLEDTDSWWTPPEIVEIVKGLFPGGFLDPCGSPESPLTRAAADSICLPRDALDSAVQWPRMPVVCNPPWSQMGRWVRELNTRRSWWAGSSLLIGPLRLDTRWCRDFNADHLLVPSGRIGYLRPDTGLPDGSPKTSSGLFLRGRLDDDMHVHLYRMGWMIWDRI